MPRFDQSFTGLCEQNLQDTLQLKQRYLDAKAKRVSKSKDKKQQDSIQSSVHVQQKFLKRSSEELDPGGQNDSFEPPVKLQCTTQQHGTHQNEGLTKFSVEIVQQLEFTTSAASSQPQQISTNVTVKTHANTSVKSDVSSPKSNPSTPTQQQKSAASNIGLDVGTLVECVKQEPENDLADLDQCAGFGVFPDFMGDDTNDEIMSSAAFKDLISDISDYPDFDFEDKPDNISASNNVNNMKIEEPKDLPKTMGSDGSLKNTQSPLLQHQNNNYSPPVFENKSRMPYSNMDFTKTELSPAAHTLKQMAEQHQHKNQMGLSFNPSSRAPNSRSPYSDFQQFPQGDYGSPNSNAAPNFHKNSPGFPSPDMIKQELIFQSGEFGDMKRKSAGMYKQQYSPYSSPSASSHGSPSYLPRGGGGPGPNANPGPFGGGTPPRPPSGHGGNGSGPSVQINQAQQLNISQQNHGHGIQVSAGQHLHLSGDIKGNVSIAAQQGVHFTQHQQHSNHSSAGSGNTSQQSQSHQSHSSQNSQPSSQNSPLNPQHQHSPMQGGGNVNSQHGPSPMNQKQMGGGNMGPMGQQMGGNQMGGQQSGMGGGLPGSNGMQGGNNMQGPNGMSGPGNGINSPGNMQGGMGGMMGGPGMQYSGGMPGDTYSMSQTQTINFTQQTLQKAAATTGLSNPMTGASAPMGPTGPMGQAGMGPRLMNAAQTEQQKLLHQQQILRAQQQAAMQHHNMVRPPPPDYKTSAGMMQGMQPRYGAAPPNMRRMPHQPIPPSGPMIRSNMYMLQQQQLQQQPPQQQMSQSRTAMYARQQGPMAGMEPMQHNSAEWRHLLMSQQQNTNFGSMRPNFQQGFNMNSGNSLQMSALQHQQLRTQQGMVSGGGMGGNQQAMSQAQMIGPGNSPMAQMSNMNQAMLSHMQQQQSLMQQQNSQMSMSTLHMQQSQSISITNQSMQQQQQQQQQQPGSMGSILGGGPGGNNPSNNSNSQNNALSNFNPQADFNFEFLDILPTGDSGFTDQELLNSFDSDAGFNLDF